MAVSDLEFRSWLAGTASLFRRAQALGEGQRVQDLTSVAV